MLTSASLVAVKTAAIVPAAAEYDGFHPPSLDDFYPAALFLAGTPFEINRIMLVRIVMTLLLVLVFGIGAARAKVVPGRFQNALELMLGFVRKNVSEEILGPVYGKKFAPLLTTIFLGVFFLNISGIIPGLQIASTGVVGMPLVFALVSYIAFIYAGLRENGVVGYFKGTVMPSGVPGFLAPLIIPIEFLSNLVMRPLTLTIRLMANMISGHLLLALCFVATNALFFYASAQLKALGTVTLLLGLAFVLFEAFVAALQAYIFALLTAVYIDSSVHMH
ncbi:F-ATPase subunit 6 [Actinomyces bovis]|uniref:ATP synthase subunit a n=1 Tax=Actinomyces bovis TaxID=1658 RepID=A0ABY1VL15_9ACTO|nr:F0F1 ATP synthase subunit A [Actinomyces bovis]SPT52801.1 F-ATPase subunit 6 [Actinomyces bovis]VEG54842.1 F-ATPase subunit 6 [Actinomyces israelii]